MIRYDVVEQSDKNKVRLGWTWKGTQRWIRKASRGPLKEDRTLLNGSEKHPEVLKQLQGVQESVLRPTNTCLWLGTREESMPNKKNTSFTTFWR